MSPEYNFYVAIRLNLSTDSKARQVADGLKRTLAGVEYVRFAPTPGLDLGEPNSGDLTLGQTLRYFRKGEGLSRKELAASSELNPATISRIELGKVIPTRNSLSKIIGGMGWEDNDQRAMLLQGKLSAHRDVRGLNS